MIAFSGASLSTPYLADTIHEDFAGVNLSPDAVSMSTLLPSGAAQPIAPALIPLPSQFAINSIGLGITKINIGSNYWLTVNEVGNNLLLENSLTNMKTTITATAKISVNAASDLTAAPVPVAAPVIANKASLGGPGIDPILETTGALPPVLQIIESTDAMPTIAMPLSPSVAPVLDLTPQMEEQATSIAHALSETTTPPELAPPLIAAETPDEASTNWLQFWGTTSFAYGDDGMITLQTKATGNASGDYILDRVTVTNGERGVVITGMALDGVGNVQVEQSAKGYELEENTRDGLLLVENGDATGWIGAYDDPFDQTLLNETAVGADYGPGSTCLSLPEVNKMMMASLSFMQSSIAMSNTINTIRDISNDINYSDDKRRSERILLDHILAQRHAEWKLEPYRF